jgi:hypothetical protein
MSAARPSKDCTITRAAVAKEPNEVTNTTLLVLFKRFGPLLHDAIYMVYRAEAGPESAASNS